MKDGLLLDHFNHARRLRDRAEECRILAEIATNPRVRNGYLEMVAMYMALASDEEAFSLRARILGDDPALIHATATRTRS